MLGLKRLDKRDIFLLGVLGGNALVDEFLPCLSLCLALFALRQRSRLYLQ